MNWVRFSNGFRLDPVAERLPEALVVVLQDFGSAAGALNAVVARWARAVPTTAFIVLDAIEAMAPDRATRRLEALLERQLRSRRLDASRLVLVGFGQGGTLALHLVLQQGLGCAGVLALAAKLLRPLPGTAAADHKIRLIGCAGNDATDHRSLRDFVAQLTALGIDARGVLLMGSVLSDEAVRHGGAYLVELVAIAQRGDRFRLDRQRRRAATRLPSTVE